jgi:hypothetical protein
MKMEHIEHRAHGACTSTTAASSTMRAPSANRLKTPGGGPWLVEGRWGEGGGRGAPTSVTDSVGGWAFCFLSLFELLSTSEEYVFQKASLFGVLGLVLYMCR